MRVRDAMTTPVVTIGPDSSLEHAAQQMREAGIGFLPVCEQRHPLGVVTDRDIIIRGVAQGRDVQTTTLREVMSPRAYSCYADDALAEAARKMQAHTVRRLMVLNDTDEVVGVISLDDLVAAGEQRAGEVVLEQVADPGRPDGLSG